MIWTRQAKAGRRGAERGRFGPAGLAACLLALLLALAPALPAQETQREPIPITAVILKDFPPDFMLDGQGQPTGFAIEALREIAALAGLRVQYLLKDNWGEVIEALATGRADLCPYLAATEDRKDKLDFTSPLQMVQVSLFTRKTSLDLAGVSDLGGRRVGVIRRGAAWEMLRRHSQAVLLDIDKTGDAIFQLLAGQVDALAGPEQVIWELAHKAGVHELIKVVGEPLLEISRTMAVAKGNDELLRLLNPAVRSLVASAEYQKIYTRWYGKPPEYWTASRVTWAMSGLLLACLLAMALWRYRGITRLNRRLVAAMSQRREAEDRAARLASIVASSEESIVGLDMSGNIISWNRGAERLYGYRAEEAEGKPVSMLIPPGHRDQGLEYMRKALAGERVEQYETVRLTKDGRRLLLSISLSPLLDATGRRIGVSGIARDISARKAAEEALKASEEKFAKAFQQAPMWVLLTSFPQGVFLEVNEAFFRQTGYARPETLGRTSLELGLWAVPHERLEFVGDMKEHGRVREKLCHFRIKSGEVRPFLISAEVIQVGGRPCQLSICQDVTERKKAEEEKSSLEAQLRQAQKMEAVGTLAGGIAHDFNNILAAIMGFAEMAEEDLRANGRVNPRDLKQIMDSAQRAKELVRQILTFSRKQEPALKPVDLNQIVRRTLPVLERTLPKMIDIEAHLAPNLPPTQADETQMEQVLLNLSSNARDAMPEGGRLLLETRAVEIDQDYSRRHLEVRPGAYVQLTVSDTGQGMDEEQREHIFEPFYTTKEIGKGTGLGLASVYGIVKNHGGHIHCYSEVGTGTVFKIYLPVIQAGRAASGLEEATDGGEVPGGSESILLVDDEEALRLLGERTLKSKGYRVTCAASGEEALSLYSRPGQRPDLVIMDLGMPGMGGHKAIKAILEIDPGARIVIASGYSAQGRAKAALAEGAAGYVAKPFHRNELLTTVRNVLDKP